MPDIQDLLATEIGGFSLGNLLAGLVIFLVSLLVIKLLMKAIKKVATVVFWRSVISGLTVS